MILAVFEKGAEHFCNLYDNWEQYHKDTFSPECRDIVKIELGKAKGSSYEERKEYVRATAMIYSNMRGQFYPLSWREAMLIGNWFEKYGRRYGLLKEFHENAIC